MPQNIQQLMQQKWFDIFLGFSIPMIMGMCKYLIDRILLNGDKRKNNFDLEGLWCSIHKNFKNQYPIEFVRIKYAKDNQMIIKIKQFRENNQVRKFIGNGIKSNNFIYILYKSVSKNDQRGGVFMLELKTRLDAPDYMEGTYLENGTEKKERKKTSYYPIDSYKLYPIYDSNLFSRIKTAYTIFRLKKYTDAKVIMEKYAK